MTAIVASMRAGDAAALAPLLPSTGALRVTSTLEIPPLGWDAPADRLQAELRQGGELRTYLLGGGGEDSVRDLFEATDFGPWERMGEGRFEPAGDAFPPGLVFMRLDCEGARPVLAEIGVPHG